jgi:hypothetical protein
MRQFSIRDLLFVIVIVALILGWWFDRRPVPARFQMTSTSGHAFVLDTSTGQVWAMRADPNSNIGGNANFFSPKIPK